MIMLVSFSGLERSLFEKASEELEIAQRINYFDDLDAMFERCETVSQENRSQAFPRAIVMNIDAPTCFADLDKLKSFETWKKIPKIGYGFLEDQNDVSKFYSHGGVSCIRKPDSYAELISTTRAAMYYWLSMSVLPCDYLKEA